MMSPVPGLRLGSTGNSLRNVVGQNAVDRAELAQGAAKSKAETWQAKRQADEIRESGKDEARGLVQQGIFSAIGSFAPGLKSLAPKTGLGISKATGGGGFDWNVVDSISPTYQ